MNFNLENRPRPGCYKGDPEERIVKAVNSWFEGFEKELRELRAKRVTEYAKGEVVNPALLHLRDLTNILGDSP